MSIEGGEISLKETSIRVTNESWECFRCLVKAWNIFRHRRERFQLMRRTGSTRCSNINWWRGAVFVQAFWTTLLSLPEFETLQATRTLKEKLLKGVLTKNSPWLCRRARKKNRSLKKKNKKKTDSKREDASNTGQYRWIACSIDLHAVIGKWLQHYAERIFDIVSIMLELISRISCLTRWCVHCLWNIFYSCPLATAITT